MVILGLSPFTRSILPSRLLGSFFSNPSLTVETFYTRYTPVIFVTILFLALFPLLATHR